MRFSAPRYLLAQFRNDRWVSIALAVIVLVVALVVTAWPRMTAAVDNEQVDHELAQLSVQQRDLIMVQQGPSPRRVTDAEETEPPSVEQTWGERVEGLADLRAQQPEPLRSAMGEAGFTVSTPPVEVEPAEGHWIARVGVAARVDPYLDEHVELTEGRWPELWEPPERGTRAEDAIGGIGTAEVVISVDASEELDWPVGESRGVDGIEGPSAWAGSVTVTGLYQPIDAEDPYWQHQPYAPAPGIIDDPDLGAEATVAGYLAAATPGTGMPLRTPSTEVRVWYPLDGTGVAGSQVPDLLDQVRGFTASEHTIPSTSDTQPALAVNMSTEVTGTLERLVAQQTSTHAILGIVAAGPLGVTLAVLALAARLIVSRRQSALALAGARGASGGQLRSMMAVEGLALGMPAAALGFAAALWLVPGQVTASAMVLPILVALSPAALLALSTSARGLRGERTDLAGRSASRIRWILEVLVVAAAAVATALLLQRGLATPEEEATAADPGVDPLLAATPVLLAAAACVIALRAYPWPIRALQGVFHQQRGLTSYLGSARAVRDPAGGLVPAIALVVGVSVATFSAVMFTTVSRGAEVTAWSAVGGDLRVSGPILGPEEAEQIGGIDGVGTLATVADVGATPLSDGGSAERVTMIAVDAAALAQVQDDVPDATELPAALTDTSSGRLPIVTGGELALGSGEAEIIGQSAATVVGHVEELTGVGTGSDFFVVDREAAAALTEESTYPRLGLIGLTEAADPGAVAEEVQAGVPNSVVENPAENLETFRASPVSAGLNLAFVVAVVLAGALCVLAVVLTQLLSAPARARLLSVLRTLGLDRRQSNGIVAWELVPLVAVSFVVGAGLGFAVPTVLLQAVDLRALTNAPEQPPLSLDPLILLAVCGGIVLAVAAAVTAPAAIGSRADLAQQLRVGDER